MDLSRWRVGRATITCIVEEETRGIPPVMFFPAACEADVAKHAWLQPDFADARGRIAMAVQAFVVELDGRCILVDPCVGNGKTSAIAYWNDRSFSFLERFHEAGFRTEAVDTVLHTHLHADHVGWDTQKVDGRWTPTFRRARHLYTQRELDWCRRGGNPGIDHVFEESVAPILDAGLADIVAENAELAGGLKLAPSPGHTPGHVSLWIESEGEGALVSGDFLHHPVQCAEPDWAEVGDEDAEAARRTRREMLASAERKKVLFFGTHFPAIPAGRIEARDGAWRFVPLRGGEVAAPPARGPAVHGSSGAQK